MKQNLFILLLAASPLLFSCQKENMTVANENAAVSKVTFPELQITNTTQRENCEPFPFAILTLNSGAATTMNMHIVGNLGYSRNVVSTSNTNLNVNGTCYKHSIGANLVYSTASYIPVLGIQTGEGVDSKLDQSNTYATTLSAAYDATPVDITYGNITTNKTINSTCTATGRSNTVVNMTSLNLSNETLTLVGAPSSDDGFIINVTGSFTMTGSEIKLNGVRPERVLFNFPNASLVQVKTDSKFRGTILAPTGTVVYLSPDKFEGSIVAKTVYAVDYGNTNNGGGYSSGGCGGGSSTPAPPPPANFIQKTYCNGYQWE